LLHHTMLRRQIEYMRDEGMKLACVRKTHVQ
jgi:hypothetical protein